MVDPAHLMPVRHLDHLRAQQLQQIWLARGQVDHLIDDVIPVAEGEVWAWTKEQIACTVLFQVTELDRAGVDEIARVLWAQLLERLGSAEDERQLLAVLDQVSDLVEERQREISAGDHLADLLELVEAQ